MYKTYRIRKEIRPILTGLLLRDGIDFSISSDETEITLDMSGNRFHRYVKQAVCEQQRENSGHPELPVLPKEVILNDRALLKYLLATGKTEMQFTMLDEEVKTVLKKLQAYQIKWFEEPEQFAETITKDMDIPYCTLSSFVTTIGKRETDRGILLCKHLLTISYHGENRFYPIL